MKKNKHLILIILTCSLVSVMLLSCSKALDAEAVNKRRAENIISALYEYEQEYTSFPNQLIDLVPVYIDAIPTTVEGEDFFYSIDSVNGFNLSFMVKSNFGCGYSDQSQQWECGYGD